MTLSFTARGMAAPARIRKREAYALKALFAGTATDVQQKAALGWIVNEVAEIGRAILSGSPHEMAVCEGRRAVGVEVMGVVMLPSEYIEKLED